MRAWLKTGAIPDDPELKAELTGREYGFDLHNAIRLEKKEDMKKRGLSSPDNADGLALTFAYPVADLPAEMQFEAGGGLRRSTPLRSSPITIRSRTLKRLDSVSLHCHGPANRPQRRFGRHPRRRLRPADTMNL